MRRIEGGKSAAVRICETWDTQFRRRDLEIKLDRRGNPSQEFSCSRLWAILTKTGVVWYCLALETKAWSGLVALPGPSASTSAFLPRFPLRGTNPFGRTAMFFFNACFFCERPFALPAHPNYTDAPQPAGAGRGIAMTLATTGIWPVIEAPLSAGIPLWPPRRPEDPAPQTAAREAK